MVPDIPWPPEQIRTEVKSQILVIEKGQTTPILIEAIL